MTDFPLTPSEAIAVYWVVKTRVGKMRGGEAADYWASIADRLKTWGEANLEPEPEEVMTTQDAQPRDLWDLAERPYAPPAAPPLLDEWGRSHEAEQAKHPQHLLPGQRSGYVGGPVILDETQDWPSGVGGSQCEGCGQTTIVRGFGDDMLGEPTVYLCKPCATGSTDDDEVQP